MVYEPLYPSLHRRTHACTVLHKPKHKPTLAYKRVRSATQLFTSLHSHTAHAISSLAKIQQTQVRMTQFRFGLALIAIGQRRRYLFWLAETVHLQFTPELFIEPGKEAGNWKSLVKTSFALK